MPSIILVYDSYVQPKRGIPRCDAETRRRETLDAVSQLIPYLRFPVVMGAGLQDDQQYAPEQIAARLKMLARSADEVWAPAWEPDGHEHHNLVAEAADLAYPGKVKRYLTYTRTMGKSRGGKEVVPQSGEEIARKLKALACYTSQLQMDERLGCWPHFMRDLSEYVVE